MKLLPTMKQLQYLTALAEHMHFGLAAEACFVTQSTLSSGIRDLEEVLNAPVAERTNRSVMLTPLGEKLAERARQLINDAEAMVELANEKAAPLSGLLRLGVIPTIGPYLLPRVVPALHRAYPDLELYLREDYSDRLLDWLGTGKLDALLMALPFPMDGVETDVLFDDGFVLACPPDHPLAKRSSVGMDEFADEPLLLLEEGHCLRQHSLAACSLEGRAKSKGFEATSMPTLIQMVVGGIGITLLPEMAAEAGIAKGLDLSLVPLKKGTGTRQIGLIWRKTSSRGEEFRLLGDFIKGRMGKEDG